MNSKNVMEYLRSFCRDLDEGRTPSRFELRRVIIPMAVPAALGLAMALPGGCGPRHITPDDGVEVCDNGVDDDFDGAVDCLDSDCAEDEACGDEEYEDVCNDGVDNDSDGLTDCCDDDCAEAEWCAMMMCPAYGGPFQESNCNDCRDDDCDGLADSEDPDCVELYGIQFEDCCDGVDNDGDGLADCEDSNCDGLVRCLFYRYGAPMPETECADGVDNDSDGYVDYDDPDCSQPDCIAGDVPMYGVPFL